MIGLYFFYFKVFSDPSASFIKAWLQSSSSSQGPRRWKRTRMLRIAVPMTDESCEGLEKGEFQTRIPPIHPLRSNMVDARTSQSRDRHRSLDNSSPGMGVMRIETGTCEMWMLAVTLFRNRKTACSSNLRGNDLLQKSSMRPFQQKGICRSNPIPTQLQYHIENLTRRRSI